jgi:hypothetical protein
MKGRRNTKWYGCPWNSSQTYRTSRTGRWSRRGSRNVVQRASKDPWGIPVLTCRATEGDSLISRIAEGGYATRQGDSRLLALYADAFSLGRIHPNVSHRTSPHAPSPKPSHNSTCASYDQLSRKARSDLHSRRLDCSQTLHSYACPC